MVLLYVNAHNDLSISLYAKNVIFLLIEIGVEFSTFSMLSFICYLMVRFSQNGKKSDSGIIIKIRAAVRADKTGKTYEECFDEAEMEMGASVISKRDLFMPERIIG